MSLIHRRLKIGPEIIPLFPTQVSFAFIYVWTSVIWKSQPLARKMELYNRTLYNFSLDTVAAWRHQTHSFWGCLAPSLGNTGPVLYCFAKRVYLRCFSTKRLLSKAASHRLDVPHTDISQQGQRSTNQTQPKPEWPFEHLDILLFRRDCTET